MKAEASVHPEQRAAVNNEDNIVAQQADQNQIVKRGWEDDANDHARDNPGCHDVHTAEYPPHDPDDPASGRPTKVTSDLYGPDGKPVPGMKQEFPNPDEPNQPKGQKPKKVQR